MSDWIVSTPDRLDAFLASEGRMLSRVKAQKAIEEKQVKVNGRIIKKSAERLQEGDRVELIVNPDDEVINDSSITPVDLSLPILYEDAACFVINKPAGFAVHPGAGMTPGEQTILGGIAFILKKKRKKFSPEAVLVHRLDKDTTGCLLVAKTPEAHRFLQAQFETRTVRKTYLALVAGVPQYDEATVDAPIGRSLGNRTKMSVNASLSSREAQTTYRVVSTDAARKAALLECDLHTGRTHQIRVHLQSIGHPVLGDDSYVNAQSERLTREFDITTICLHAWKLKFVSPADKKEHAVEAGLPESFLRVLEVAGIDRGSRA